jgi:hypothetical protein
VNLNNQLQKPAYNEDKWETEGLSLWTDGLREQYGQAR